jgi:DNA topoisomerase IB
MLQAPAAAAVAVSSAVSSPRIPPRGARRSADQTDRARTGRRRHAVDTPGARGRRRQVREAVRAAVDSLANTPAICRRSDVHETVVKAFESGVLEDLSATIKHGRTAARREQLVAQVLAQMIVQPKRS